jgi:predicted ATP-dependent serine protease
MDASDPELNWAMAEYTRTIVCPILIGRDDLLELGDRRLAEVASGRGHLLFVAGEAGIGKSRLVSAIERRASASGMRTIRAGTYPSDLQVAAARSRGG